MLRPFLVGAGLALGGLGAFASTSLVARTPTSSSLPFAVTHVTVEGAVHARSVEVRHLADVHHGTPIWSISAAAVAEAVERHPWVRSAQVDVIWPGTVEIRVVERQVAGVLLDRERWLYVDDRGTAFLEARDLDHPVFTDMGRTLDRIHPDLGQLARRRAVSILEVLQREEVLASEQISEVAFAPNVGFVVHTSGATLLFRLDEIERQVRALVSDCSNGIDLSHRLTIDLAPEHVALVRPTAGRYPTVVNDFRPPRGLETVAQVTPSGRGPR